MVDITKFLKEVKELSINAKSVLNVIMEYHNNNGIPNMVLLNQNHAIFNIKMSEIVNNCNMSFSIYECGANKYLLDLVSFVPQENFTYPPDVSEGDAEFIITGGPTLGAHNLQKPISALSLHEAIEAALEYVTDNMEDIIKEMLGGEGIQRQE